MKMRKTDLSPKV